MLPDKLGIVIGIMIPFMGTAMGAAFVFCMKRALNGNVRGLLAGFAAGVMVAASVWSLLIPAMEQVEGMGRLAFLPAVCGFWLGILFLYLLDRAIPCPDQEHVLTKCSRRTLSQTGMLVLAVTIHNIPEGMAVGVIFAGWLSGDGTILLTEALALSIGIAIQNIPEGAIISMPLRAEGMKKGKSFFYGVLSGAVEPAAAWLTILASSLILRLLPCLLSFAAGAMVYVVVEELIPETQGAGHSHRGVLAFALGFTIMLALDVALG